MRFQHTMKEGAMYLHQMATDSFALIQADWTLDKARQLVQALDPTHVIVRRTEDQETYFYLYTKDEALGFLNNDDRWTVLMAANLHEYTASPTAGPYADATTVPPRTVVVEDGMAVGLIDPNIPSTQRRGLRRGEGGGAPGQPRPRSLEAEFPEQVALDDTVSLLVFLTAEEPSSVGLPIALSVGTTIDILVQVKRGFALEGRAEGQLTIADEDETLPLQFKLKATGLGPGQVYVLAFHQGQPLGKITLAPTVVPAGQPADMMRRGHREQMAPLRVQPPDLSLIILEERIDGDPAFSFRINAADPNLNLNFTPFGPVKLRLDPLPYFEDFFKDIEDLDFTTATDRAKADLRLAAKGAQLFEDVIPENLRQWLWEHYAQIKSVQVQSEEPWIPWELCKLYGTENGRIVEGPFFSEAFAITRWRLGIGFKPALTMDKMALVVPTDSGLDYADNERDYVKSLAGGRRQVERIPATFLAVQSALTSGEYDAWHFSGHGSVRAADPNRSIMYLEQDDEFTPEALSGRVKNLGIPKPLVFLNACQIGQSAHSLTGIGGWAARFLDAGAGAFVGAYWSVYDEPAYDFAVAFYSRLLAGIPIGQAAQEARLEIKSPGDPTWLAYTVFADPLAMVQI
jgi:hypothetical protein